MAYDLSSVVRTGQARKPPILTIYGTPGVGKTSFAANAPKPIFLQAEDGAFDLEFDTFGVLTKFDEFQGHLNALLEQDHEYKTLVIDTLDHLEAAIAKDLCEQEGKKSLADFPYGSGGVKLAEKFKAILDLCVKLRDKKNMAVIWLAHSDAIKVDDPMTETYSQHQLKLHKKIIGFPREMADAIFFADFIRQIESEQQGMGKRNRAIGSNQRVLYTQPMAGAVIKSRFQTPDSMPFSWDALKPFLMQKKGEVNAA